jgi:riboflavin synthase
MFTGLVEELGTVRQTQRRGDYLRLQIDCTTVLDGLRTGDSVSIEGACQTVVRLDDSGFAVDTLAETLRKTTLGGFAVGTRVNLERALRLSDRLGGHLVQGHVDGVGVIESVVRSGKNIYLTVGLEPKLLRYCVSEGSIAVNGISLTIASMTRSGVSINIIPETWNRTSLQNRKAADAVNIEVDILARYVERLLPAHTGTALNADKLNQWGYGGKHE